MADKADHATYSAACGDGIGMITTWLGTPVSTHDWIGRRVYTGFHRAYRRPVSCRIFGVLYHGWFMESSGNYVRLTKAKGRKK